MTLNKLPDETIIQLLTYTPPDDIFTNFQLVSRRLRRIGNEPIVWKRHCLQTFRFWHPSHDIEDAVSLAPHMLDWKGLYILRQSRNSRIAKLLDEIIRSPVYRLKNMAEICQLGYDSKDFLLEQCHTDGSAEDGLARRYFASTILDSVHRGVAIEEWRDLWASHDSIDVPPPGARRLERALGAFDMFVLYDQPGDLNDISAMLDDMASSFEATQPTLNDMTTRQKALALNRWLRLNDYTGLQDPERDYRNLRNCLIGQALRHEDHDSIPIISSAIFCAVAERLSMTAQCCAFPSHVHAVVVAEPGQTLDNTPVEGLQGPRLKMYLDPYGKDDEVPEEILEATLARIGQQIGNNDIFLSPVPPTTIVVRTARNMSAAINEHIPPRRPGLGRPQEVPAPAMAQLLRGDLEMNARACRYAASWATLMMTTPNTLHWKSYVRALIAQFPSMLHEDSWLVKNYLWPMTGQTASEPHRFNDEHDPENDPWEQWQSERLTDETPPEVLRRDSNDSHFIPYKVGQVFTHQRYGWTGAIVGWNDSSRLYGRRGQDPGKVFYSVLHQTKPQVQIIAEENIRIVNDPSLVREGMFLLAGKFFKRFDRASCTFVSNVKHQYPDD